MQTYFDRAIERARARDRSEGSRLRALNRKLRLRVLRGQDTAYLEKELNGIYRNLYRLRMKG